MNPYKRMPGFLLVAILILLNIDCLAQVLVNDKNLNEDKSLQYIQLMYYIDKANLKPIYFLDYGNIEPEYNEILKPENYHLPKITIDGEKLSANVSPVGVLNKLHNAGWEYMGDGVYFPTRILDNWYIFTLKRK